MGVGGGERGPALGTLPVLFCLRGPGVVILVLWFLWKALKVEI